MSRERSTIWTLVLDSLIAVLEDKGILTWQEFESKLKSRIIPHMEIRKEGRGDKPELELSSVQSTTRGQIYLWVAPFPFCERYLISRRSPFAL